MQSKRNFGMEILLIFQINIFLLHLNLNSRGVRNYSNIILQLCLIIVPRRDTQMYSFVKSNAEIQYGVMTQCVQAKNVGESLSVHIKSVSLDHPN